MQQLFRTTLLPHFFMRAPATGRNVFSSGPVSACAFPSPDYPKLSVSRISLCLSLDRHAITYAGNISQGNKSANSRHKTNKKSEKEKFSPLFFAPLELNVLYSISFGRVLIRQAINANVGNLKTFKPLLMLLRLTDSVQFKLNGKT